MIIFKNPILIQDAMFLKIIKLIEKEIRSADKYGMSRSCYIGSTCFKTIISDACGEKNKFKIINMLNIRILPYLLNFYKFEYSKIFDEYRITRAK